MMSGPAVAAWVVLHESLEVPFKANARVRVLVAAAMTRISSTDWVNRRRRSRAVNRQMSRSGPMGLDVQPGHVAKTVPGLVVHRRVFDECPVPHGDQPVRSGGDSLVVGDDDQREPGSA